MKRVLSPTYHTELNLGLLTHNKLLIKLIFGINETKMVENQLSIPGSIS